MKNFPLVSILIPTYNQPELFRVALESALNQTYPNIEIIVSDDSTDDHVKNICAEYKDVKYIYHGGIYTNETNAERALLNIENLLLHANGEFVNVLMHDDVIYSEKISKMMNYFQNDIDNKIAIVSSSRDVIDINGNIINHIDLLDQLNAYPGLDHIILTGEEVGRLIFLVLGNFIGEHSTVLLRKKDFYRSEVQRYTNSYCFGIKDTSYGDLSVFLEACKDGRGLVFIREPLSCFRGSNENQNSKNITVIMYLCLDFIQFAVAAYIKNIYLHTWKDFELACDYVADMTRRILENRSIPSTINTSVEVLTTLTIILESIQNKNYELTFKIVTDWIRKYNSDTFDFGGFDVKNFKR